MPEVGSATVHSAARQPELGGLAVPVKDSRGLLLVLSGPSGVGKTTLARELATRSDPALKPVVRSVSVTTRPPRPGETHGSDYLFVTAPGFADMVARSELLEQTEMFGHRYGTPRAFVETRLAAGLDVLLVLDAEGHRQVVAHCPGDVVSVFLLPPSPEELERRLRGRSDDAEETVRARLAAAQTALRSAEEYSHVLVNRTPQATLAALTSLRRAERLQRRWRQAHLRPPFPA